MTDLQSNPEAYSLFSVLRRMERMAENMPRIGDNGALREEIVRLTQDPYMEFASSNISKVDTSKRGNPRVHTRFLGFFGPHGALPLLNTMEAFHWQAAGDDSFVRFTEIFANRFLQLFYRAWADAQPIAQHDRPDQDRFVTYLGAIAGVGSKPFQGRDSVSDQVKVPYAALVGAASKSPARLKQMIEGLFGVDVDIKEHVGSWLSFEKGDMLSIGTQGASLGVDTILGGRAYSINDKFRIVVRTETLENYESFLPTGSRARQLADIVFFCVGYRYEYDVELSLPSSAAPRLALGKSGRLGWSGWLGAPPTDRPFLSDARFHPAQWQDAAAPEPAAGSAKARKRP